MRRIAAIALALATATPAGPTLAQGVFDDIDWYTAYRAGYFIGDFEADDTTNRSTVTGDSAGIESSIAFGGGFLDYGVAELELVYQYDTESDLEFDTGRASTTERAQNFMLGAIASVGARFDYDIFRFSALGGVGFGARYIEFEDPNGTFSSGETANSLLFQARLGAELRLDDNWGFETFYRFRYEDTGDYTFTRGGNNFDTEVEITNDHMIGLGLVYSFGGGDSASSSRANTAATVPTTPRFSSFPPPAEGPVQTAGLRADRALASTIAPPPAAIAELRALRQRLAELEEQAASIRPARVSPLPRDEFPTALGPYSGEDAPPLAARAPPRSRSMAQIAADMRDLRSDISGEREPSDPLFGGN